MRHLPTAVVCALALATTGEIRPALAQNATTGAITGIARDQETGEPLAGVLVSARGGGREETAMTDARGVYKLTGLPPGDYQLLFHYAGVTVRVNGVRVLLDKTRALHAQLDLSKSGVTYEFDGRAPVLDPTASGTGETISREMLERAIYPGNDVVSSLGVIPTTASDGLGITFGGSSSPESRINLDGMDTTGIKYGTLGGSLLADFVEEVNVATGGYNAEYGRSTGAVINVVTKTGTNELTGSVFTRMTPGFLTAARKIARTESSSIDADVNAAYDADFGIELGGPIIKDRLWYYVGFAPQLSRTDVDRITKRLTDCRTVLPSGELSPCDPVANRDGMPDVDPETGFRIYEELDRERLSQTRSSYPFLAKLNWAPRAEHQGQISLVGTPASGNSIGIAGTPAATRQDFTQLTTDLAAKWTSKLDDNKTELSAVVGWHRVATEFDSIDDAWNDVPREDYLGVSLAHFARFGFESMDTLVGCTDGGDGDPYPLIENCPDDSTGYATGGPGNLVDEVAERRAARFDAIRRVDAGGNHELKAGIDLEDNRLSNLRALSGGVSYLNYGTTIFASRWVELAPAGGGAGFDDLCRNGGIDGELLPCRFVDSERATGRTINWAAYLRDSWQPVPNLTLNLGLRYEEQRLRYARELQNTVDATTGNQRGSNAMVLRGMWSPRVGFAYDWTKEGKSRLFANWGRFYEAIPLDINDRSFGGETLYRATYDGSQCGPGDLDLPSGGGCDAGDPSDGFIFGAGTLVAPGVKAQYMDEYLIGAEYELTEDLKVGATYQSRSLGRVLEDVSVDNAQTYILANPGEWSADAERELERRIAAADPDEAARLSGQLDQLRKVRDFDRPRRDYRAITLTATRRFSRRIFAQASYTYSRNTGNYPGLFSPDNGQLDPNISSQYDLIELLANRDGPLPQDRPHYIKLDGWYTFDLSRHDSLTVGGRARALSGTPRDALARHYLYGFNESFLLPRGAMGRTDFDYGLDVRLAYGRALRGGMQLELYADIFNLLNRQGTARVSEAYTLDDANPVVGGDFEDLVFAKQVGASGGETSDPLTRHLNFGNTTARYAPLSARLGARLTF